MGRFIYNLAPDTFTAQVQRELSPFGYLLAPNNATPQLTGMAQQARQAGLPLLVDNGNFALIGQVRKQFRQAAGDLHDQVRDLETTLGRSVRPRDMPPALRSQFWDLTVTVREHVRAIAGSGETNLQEQLALDPTHLIGVEDITPACWLALDIEQTYSGRRRRDYRRMNESVARKAAQRIPQLPSHLRGHYYPVASAVSYSTAHDAGRVFAEQRLTHVSMGFGAFMADANYTDHTYIGRKRIDFPSRLPNRYTRTALVARGFWEGYQRTAGQPPEGFHFLGLGAPIMMPIVALAAQPTADLTFDATSPIKDALRDGMLYVTKPAYLKIRIRKAALKLAANPNQTWDCPCPFCTAFTKQFPFDYPKGNTWHKNNPSKKVQAADLRPGGDLSEAYPLFSEPSPGPLRDAVDTARVGHNHWALEEVLRAIRDARAGNQLQEHVEKVVQQYIPTTSPPFARSVGFALKFSAPVPASDPGSARC